jgi:transposase
MKFAPRQVLTLAGNPIQYGGMTSKEKVGYPSDVSDEEWAFVLPYLLLSREDSAHREHDLRAVFNGVRYIARTGNQWRFMPHDYPPWPAIYQQMQRWMRAACFERLVEDTRILLREFAGRKGQPTAACIDSRTLQSTPESGARAGYDGAKRRKGSKVHIAVDTLGHLLALSVTPADQGDRAQVEVLAKDMQQVTGGTVEMAYVDQGYTGPIVAEAAQSHGIRLEVVKHPMAKRGFVLLPRRWVVERSFAWAARFRRLVRDYERLDTTLKGFHYVAFACLMIANMFKQLA